MAEKLKTYKYEVSKGGLNRPQKMVKMVVPACRICNNQGQGKRDWASTCPHDPYFRIEPIPGTQEQYDVDPETDEVTVRITEGKFRRVPRIKQISDELKNTSKRMVQIQVERGAKFPEEMGYYPICDYRNCWEPLAGPDAPKEVFRTRHGNFHDRDEAAIIVLREGETPIYLGLDKDIERRREQLDRVVIR